MADGITIAVTGLKELQQQIDNIIKAFGPGPVESVLFRGAEVFAAAARQKAPYNPRRKKGIHLRDAIIVRRLRRRGSEPAPSIAAVDRKKAPHAYLVEHGSGERVIKSGRLRGKPLGKMPRQPFMRPAWNENKARVLQQITNDLGQLVDQAVRK